MKDERNEVPSNEFFQKVLTLEKSTAKEADALASDYMWQYLC